MKHAPGARGICAPCGMAACRRPAAPADWAPSLDVSETNESVVVKMEVPGIDAKDIHVSLQENILTVKGEKKQEKEDKDERYHRVERSYGAFTRTMPPTSTLTSS